MKVFVVNPDVLREFELPDQAGADHEGRDAAFCAVVWLIFRQIRAIGRSAPNHATPIYVGSRISRIHAPAMTTERHRISLRVLFLVIEVVVPLRVLAQSRVFFFWREHERRAAPPPSHQL